MLYHGDMGRQTRCTREELLELLTASHLMFEVGTMLQGDVLNNLVPAARYIDVLEYPKMEGMQSMDYVVYRFNGVPTWFGVGTSSYLFELQNASPQQKVNQPLEELENTYTLQQAKLDGCVVMENGDVTSGQVTWTAFLAAAAQGQKTSLRYITYYTLSDPSKYDPDLYQSIRDDYPALYVHDLYYDGNSYTVRWFENGACIERTYRFLMNYTGGSYSYQEDYAYHDRYVLTNDPEVTWEDIRKGMFSALSTAWVDHLSVYTDLHYAEETAFLCPTTTSQ